ncbi:MAG: hypothetical protein ACXWL2_02535 [Candidatus Chromulinivorax sp.]
MKKIAILVSLSLCLHNTSITNFNHESYHAYEQYDDDDDDFAIDDSLNNLNVDNIIVSGNLTRSPEDNAALIQAFFSYIDNPAAILNSPIYQKTFAVPVRPILEYPFALTYAFENVVNNSLSAMFFLNSTPKKNFTQDSTELGSYYLLGSPEKVATLENVDNIVGRQVVGPISKALSLLDPAKLQENRLGVVFKSHTVHNKTILDIQLPFLYAERNLFFTPVEKAALAYSPLGAMLRTDGVETEDDFIYNNIVMDQFGISDLKVKAIYQMHESPTFDFYLGGFTILPTATAFKRGMIGTWFDHNNERAYLDLSLINPLDISVENQDAISEFFLAAVDKLSSIVLDCPLGNKGHVVIAPTLNFNYYFHRKWQFSNDFSLQYSLPALEKRFYRFIQSNNDFMYAYNEAYNSDPLTFVYFVNESLQNLLFPYMYETMVHPGIVFNCTNQLLHTHHDWTFNFGSNFWYHSAESLDTSAIPLQLDYQSAQASHAAQEKLFAQATWNSESTNYSWSLSLYGDITIWNIAMGNDYTLGINVDCKF